MRITGAAKIAGVMGFPVKHSLSPRLHNFWLNQYQIDGCYIPMEIAPEYLPQVIKALPYTGIRGWNVTVPHKESLVSLVHRLTPMAERMGAVNTVIVEPDHTLTGTNTDAYGFIENLKQEAPSFAFKGIKVVVIGAGGASRAVCAGLLNEEVGEIVLVNRTKEKAENLKKHIGGNITVADWEKRHEILAETMLLVNTTTLGMHGFLPLDIDISLLPREALVTDIVYKPLQTELLKMAEKKGNKTVDGLGMLLYQAVPGFEMWFGKKAEVTKELRHFILGQ